MGCVPRICSTSLLFLGKRIAKDLRNEKSYLLRIGTALHLSLLNNVMPNVHRIETIEDGLPYFAMMCSKPGVLWRSWKAYEKYLHYKGWCSKEGLFTNVCSCMKPLSDLKKLLELLKRLRVNLWLTVVNRAIFAACLMGYGFVSFSLPGGDFTQLYAKHWAPLIIFTIFL